MQRIWKAVVEVEPWQVEHRSVIVKVLQAFRFSKLKYILKGGTALVLAYGLTRFSEDIDLDQPQGAVDFIDIMEFVCMSNGWELRVAKNTCTVKRVFIHYGGGTSH